MGWTYTRVQVGMRLDTLPANLRLNCYPYFRGFGQCLEKRLRSGRAKTVSFFKEFLLNRLNIIFLCMRYESSESHSVVSDSL